MADEAPAKSETPAEPRKEKPAANEEGGPKELDPVRYGDWERKGIAVDF